MAAQNILHLALDGRHPLLFLLHINTSTLFVIASAAKQSIRTVPIMQKALRQLHQSSKNEKGPHLRAAPCNIDHSEVIAITTF
jgi:hypothetical protein